MLDFRYACRISSALESQEHRLTEGNGASVCFCLYLTSFHQGAMLLVLGSAGAQVSLSHAATKAIVRPSRKSLVRSYRDIKTKKVGPFKWTTISITGNSRTMAPCGLKMLKNDAFMGKAN